MSAIEWSALAAIVTAALSFAAGRRLAGGSVNTSTADRLWKEAGAIREALRIEIEDLRAEITTLKHDAEEREGEISALRAEVREKERQIRDLRSENSRLSRHVDELERRLSILDPAGGAP
ncbi:MAG: hypothetical protein E6Q97_08165 [Desulfurellales bacterium]|nr:MAG: hypothetical protein E6Q97_08165 [Desulfurellales bacterium]